LSTRSENDLPTFVAALSGDFLQRDPVPLDDGIKRAMVIAR